MSRFKPTEITADEVRTYRERTGAGLMEAKRAVQREHDLGNLKCLRILGDLEDKVEFLLNAYEASLR